MYKGAPGFDRMPRAFLLKRNTCNNFVFNKGILKENENEQRAEIVMSEDDEVFENFDELKKEGM